MEYVLLIAAIIVLIWVYRNEIKGFFQKKEQAMPLIEEATATEDKPQSEQDLDSVEYGEMIKEIDLEPVTHQNHQKFVKNNRIFSHGAGLSTVASDNTNLAFTNFVGLRRPIHVPIGPDARQQPDIDQTVLQRNNRSTWHF
jgi:hypothetical protein